MFKYVPIFVALSLFVTPALAAGKCAPGMDFETITSNVKQQMKDKHGVLTEYDETTSRALVNKLSGGKADTVTHKFIFVVAMLDHIAYWAVFQDGCYVASEAVPEAQFNEFVKKALSEGNV